MSPARILALAVLNGRDLVILDRRGHIRLSQLGIDTNHEASGPGRQIGRQIARMVIGGREMQDEQHTLNQLQIQRDDQVLLSISRMTPHGMRALAG